MIGTWSREGYTITGRCIHPTHTCTHIYNALNTLQCAIERLLGVSGEWPLSVLGSRLLRQPQREPRSFHGSKSATMGMLASGMSTTGSCLTFSSSLAPTWVINIGAMARNQSSSLLGLASCHPLRCLLLKTPHPSRARTRDASNTTQNSHM